MIYIFKEQFHDTPIQFRYYIGGKFIFGVEFQLTSIPGYHGMESGGKSTRPTFATYKRSQLDRVLAAISAGLLKISS